MNNIYIGPKNLEKTILNELLNKDAFVNFKYIDINEYVDSFNTHKDDVKTVKSKLIKIKNSFKIYKSIFNDNDINTSFIKDVISIKDELVKYQSLFDLDINYLSIDNELKLILDNIDISYDFNISNSSNVRVVNINYSLINNSIVSKLIDNGASLFDPHRYENTSYTYKTRSVRDEMEFVIQYIISNKLDLNKCGVILSDSSNMNLFNTVLNHYNVPYSTNHRSVNPSAYKAVCALDYIVSPTIESYRKLVNCNLVVESNEYINKYLREHENDVNNIYSEFNKFQDEKDNSYYKKLESEANKIHKNYIDLLNNIKGVKSFDLLFKSIISSLPQDDNTNALINKINTFSIDDCIIENYENIKNELMTLKEVEPTYESYLQISDLNKPIINKEYLFVLDSTSSNFPGFKTLNSILKEEDVVNTNYPSMLARKNNLIKTLDYLNNSKETIYVYPSSSYNGKQQNLAYEIKVRNLKEIDFHVVTNAHEYEDNHHIKKTTLTTKHIINNELPGSVSKFETYITCPYSYFANYVLGLKEAKTKDLDPRTVGTIMHAVMETLINSKRKDYHNYTKDEITKIVSNDIDELKKHYPNKIKAIDYFNDRLLKTLMLEKEFLQAAELETEFTPKEVEKEINYDIPTPSNVTIKLKGYIDRVDKCSNFFRIIDYKTSNHSISKKDFVEGKRKQLQLFTYAYVYKELTGDTPLGVFYLMLNHTTQKIDAYKYSLKDGFNKVTDTAQSEFIKNHRFRTMAFSNGDGLFINPGCITGWTKNGIGKGYSIDYDEMLRMLLEKYAEIIENILKGDFNPTWDAKACDYCSYSTMCHKKYSKVKDEDDENEDEA